MTNPKPLPLTPKILSEIKKCLAADPNEQNPAGLNIWRDDIESFVVAIEAAWAENERLRSTLVDVCDELGVPGSGYPAPVAKAYERAQKALWVEK